VTGTPLDASNVRKALNHILDKGELHRRGPHQMRHTFASLLLQAGAPITYVSRQLGHKDSAITLRVYAHRLPESTAWKGVDCLDDARPSATPAQPAQKIAVGENAKSLRGNGEPGGNRTHNPQIGSRSGSQKIAEIRMILSAWCAGRGTATQRAATPAQPGLTKGIVEDLKRT
jgi:Phage integrase family